MMMALRLRAAAAAAAAGASTSVARVATTGVTAGAAGSVSGSGGCVAGAVAAPLVVVGLPRQCQALWSQASAGFHTSTVATAATEDNDGSSAADGADGGKAGVGAASSYRLGPEWDPSRYIIRKEKDENGNVVEAVGLKYGHVQEIRDDPLNKEWGFMTDMLETEWWRDRERELMGSYPLDPTGNVDPAIIEEHAERGNDPFDNGYLTEDRYMFPTGYKARPYLSYTIKKQIYYLYTQKGWSIKELSQRYRMSAERVSMILLMIRTEQPFKDAGMFDTELDSRLAEMYGPTAEEEHEEQDWNPTRDPGMNVRLINDAQLPEDMMEVKSFRSKPPLGGFTVTSKAKFRPPKGQRRHKAKYVIMDMGAPKQGKHLRVVDYDGTVRPPTKLEDSLRTWRTSRFVVHRKPEDDAVPFDGNFEAKRVPVPM